MVDMHPSQKRLADDLAFRDEVEHLDAIIDRDMELGFSVRVWRRRWSWTAFLVANRSFELACKFVAPNVGDPRKIGHNLKSCWADVIKASPATLGDENTLYASLSFGYRHWNALFNSPWEDLDALLADVYDGKPQPRNAKEYAMLDPDADGAFIHPLLPMALAELAGLLWGSVARWESDAPPGVHYRDSTVGKIQWVVGRTFETESGVNHDLDRFNAVMRELGWFHMWSRVFHVLRPFKRQRQVPVTRSVKCRRGGPPITMTDPGTPQPTYSQYDAAKALTPMFGDPQLADACVDVAGVLVKSKSWRVRSFIAASELHPLMLVNGVLTDVTGGRWHDEWRTWDEGSEKV